MLSSAGVSIPERPLGKKEPEKRVSMGNGVVSGGFYGYGLKFWLFYGYRLIVFSYG